MSERKFKVGDRVRIGSMALPSNKKYFGRVYVVTGYAALSEFYIVSDIKWTVHSRYMKLAENTCPVCNQNIEVESNKIKEHKHNNELCYGSYTPYV